MQVHAAAGGYSLAGPQFGRAIASSSSSPSLFGFDSFGHLSHESRHLFLNDFFLHFSSHPSLLPASTSFLLIRSQFLPVSSQTNGGADGDGGGGEGDSSGAKHEPRFPHAQSGRASHFFFFGIRAHSSGCDGGAGGAGGGAGGIEGTAQTAPQVYAHFLMKLAFRHFFVSELRERSFFVTTPVALSLTFLCVHTDFLSRQAAGSASISFLGRTTSLSNFSPFGETGGSGLGGGLGGASGDATGGGLSSRVRHFFDDHSHSSLHFDFLVVAHGSSLATQVSSEVQSHTPLHFFALDALEHEFCASTIGSTAPAGLHRHGH